MEDIKMDLQDTEWNYVDCNQVADDRDRGVDCDVYGDEQFGWIRCGRMLIS